MYIHLDKNVNINTVRSAKWGVRCCKVSCRCSKWVCKVQLPQWANGDDVDDTVQSVVQLLSARCGCELEVICEGVNFYAVWWLLAGQIPWTSLCGSRDESGCWRKSSAVCPPGGEFSRLVSVMDNLVVGLSLWHIWRSFGELDCHNWQFWVCFYLFDSLRFFLLLFLLIF